MDVGSNPVTEFLFLNDLEKFLVEKINLSISSEAQEIFSNRDYFRDLFNP
ncbi:unnamed protein product [Meloidogyne enterolobii]|uniref:Uncharacterized protein n=1 Tax=Meloidogyne enterolobii TaxID=390850 RepID=A0ACB1AAJ6_MELEN